MIAASLVVGVGQGCVRGPAGTGSTPGEEDMSAIDMAMVDATMDVDMGAPEDMDSPIDMTEEDLSPPLDMGDMPGDMVVSVCEPEDYLCADPFAAPACENQDPIGAACVDAARYCRAGVGCVDPFANSCLLTADTSQPCGSVAAITTASPELDKVEPALEGFGRALAISADGKFLAVAAPDPFDDTPDEMDNASGATPHVVLFERTASLGWGSGRLLQGETLSTFGNKVAIVERSNPGSYRLIVSASKTTESMIMGVAPVRSLNEQQRGAVRVFDFESGSDPIERMGLRIDGSAEVWRFGQEMAVSPDGRYLFVSHKDMIEDANQLRAREVRGAIAVYRLEEGPVDEDDTWCPVGEIRASDEDDTLRNFGEGLDVTWLGDRARMVIGAPNERNGDEAYLGRAYVLDLDLSVVSGMACDGAGAWEAERLDTDFGLTPPPNQVGFSVSLSPSGETLAIGVPSLRDGTADVLTGGVLLYRWTDAGWSKDDVLFADTPTDPAIVDARSTGFGRDVEMISDHYLAIAGTFSAVAAPMSMRRFTDGLAMYRVREGQEPVLTHLTLDRAGSNANVGTPTVSFFDKSNGRVRLLTGASFLGGDEYLNKEASEFGGFYDDVIVVAGDMDLFEYSAAD